MNSNSPMILTIASICLCLPMGFVSFATSEEQVVRLDCSTNSLPFVKLFEKEYDTRTTDSVRVFVNAGPDVGEQCQLTTNSQIHVQVGAVGADGVAMYEIQAFPPSTKTQIQATLDAKVYANKTKILIMAYFLPPCRHKSFVSVRLIQASVGEGGEGVR